MLINVPTIISNYLDIPQEEALAYVKQMSLSELSNILGEIRKDNRDEVVRLISGLSV